MSKSQKYYTRGSKYATTPRAVSKVSESKTEKVVKSKKTNQPNLKLSKSNPQKDTKKSCEIIKKPGLDNIPEIKTMSTRSKTIETSKLNKLSNVKPLQSHNIERDKNISFRVLDKKKSSPADNGVDNVDIYEFTYDPKDEPAPQKKKRKKAVRKKPTKTKIAHKSIYDQNIATALAGLRNKVSQKSAKSQTSNSVNPLNAKKDMLDKNTNNQIKEVFTTGSTKDIPIPVSNILSPNVNVEVDSEQQSVINDNINYSPVYSPIHPTSPIYNKSPVYSPEYVNDPLKLSDNISFFDDIPAASSSMNVSSKHPTASPWRAEFEKLPIKWQVNTYVKPNMTPAYESSFMNFNDSNKKKHVYTNLVAEDNESLPQLVESENQNLVQSSIVSFIKEVIDRSSKKGKRGKSATPVKANSIFAETYTNEDISRNLLSPRKDFESQNQDAIKENNLNKNKSVISDKHKTLSTHKRKVDRDENVVSLKLPHEEKEKERNSYFGFNDSEDTENISPLKKPNKRLRALKSKSRAVLQELNHGPMRAVLPVSRTKFAPNSEIVNKLYKEMKSATDAQIFPNNTKDIESTNVNQNEDDNYSVHLFEDIELVHHLKPTRKSYGNAKKVAFRSLPNDTKQVDDVAADPLSSADEEDLSDLTFKLHTEKNKKVKKKKSKKKTVSKKEKEEADAWAARFNSMCEEVDEFPLIVE